MSLHSLQTLLLKRRVSLAPRDERSEWLEEWGSELWYMPRGVALRACLGSFRDALWLRQNTTVAPRPLLYSASRCLALLCVVAIAGLAAARWFTGPLTARAALWKLAPRDLLPACALTLLFSLLLLRFAAPAEYHVVTRTRWRSRVTRGLFLAAKLIAVQPALLCGIFIWIIVAPVLPIAALLILGAWYLVLRWVVTDHRDRCPECLMLLGNRIRIGTRSSNFLEWHGAESVCPRGHGLLHLPESDMTYPATGRWLILDSSWKSLFSTQPRGGRI